MMDIRLIAVDLDGTLLNEKKEIPAGFFRTVENLRRKNVRTVIASGRQYFNLLKLFAPVKDDLLFLCENGALVFDGGKNVRCEAIPPEKLSAPFQAASAIPTASVLLCGRKSAYMLPPDEVTEKNSSLYYEKRTFSEFPLKTALAEDSIVKIAVFDREDAAKNCEPPLSPFRGEFKLSLAGKHWIDFMRSDVNKGGAMDFLQARLGIGPENCMAFGDYLNDLELLQHVHYSYAMANAHPELKSAARFEAPSNEENGVMRVLKEFFPDSVGESIPRP